MGWLECQPLELFDEGTIVQLLCIATEPGGKPRLIAIDFDRRSFLAFLEGLRPDEEGRVSMPDVLWYDGQSVRVEEPIAVSDQSDS